MSYNQTNVSKPEHTVDLSNPNLVGSIRPGKGLNCNDPDSVTLSARHPFWEDDVPPVVGDPRGVDLERCNYSFIETRDAHSLTKVLRANLGGSYRFASASAAYSEVKTLLDEAAVIVVLVDKAEAGNSLREDELAWTGEEREIVSRIEEIADGRERQEEFIREFGTHYVDVIEDGFRLAISGSYESRDEQERREFKAAFKARFGAGGVNGDIQQSYEDILKSNKTTLRSQFVSGGLVPDRPVLLSRYDDIKRFMKDVSDGAIAITDGPIRAIARSYWSSLRDFPKVREVLSSAHGTGITAEFGVPVGTVLPWYPPSEAIVEEDGVRTLQCPEGWALADGTDHPLDLRDKFVLCVPFENLAQAGGAANHSHSGSIYLPWTGGCEGGGNHMTLPETNYAFTTNEANNLPPYVGLVFIVKV